MLIIKLIIYKLLRVQLIKRFKLTKISNIAKNNYYQNYGNYSAPQPPEGGVCSAIIYVLR